LWSTGVYKTVPDALPTAFAVARMIAEVPAVVRVCDGFVGSRMLAQRSRQAEKLHVRKARCCSRSMPS